MTVSLRFWLLSVLIAGVCGYLVGVMDQDPVAEYSPESSVKPEAQVDGVSMPVQSAEITPSSRPEPATVLPVIHDTEPSVTSSDVEESTEEETGLAQTGEALAQQRQDSREHLQQRKVFEDNFDPDTQDYDAQVIVSDYLQLHEHADKIDLQMLRCDASRCQLIGQFEGDPKIWSTVVDQMQEEDWWTYKGTSSTSNSRDGTTYFNVFLSK